MQHSLGLNLSSAASQASLLISKSLHLQFVKWAYQWYVLHVSCQEVLKTDLIMGDFFACCVLVINTC